MTPEQVHILTAVLAIVQNIGTLPVMSVMALVVLAPWGLLTFVSLNQNKRFETVVQMYKDNVHLVEEVSDLAGGYRELITWTVTTVSEAKESAEKNQFCPIVRKNTNPKDIQDIQ